MRSITIFMRYSDTILLYLAANVRRAKQKARHGAFMFSVHLEFFALSKCKAFIPYSTIHGHNNTQKTNRQYYSLFTYYW